MGLAALSSDRFERRSVQRVRLPEPLRGSSGSARVFVIDISLRGLKIAHQDVLGRVDDVCPVRFEWSGRSIELSATIRRIEVRRPPSRPGEKTLYHSGMEIAKISPYSAAALRELIEYHISRAIDEQKANARGIPPTAASSYQTGSGTEFVRHELIAGQWREAKTIDPRQPPNGFTISAATSHAEVEMLRETFAGGDASTRRMIQEMSRMSVSKSEGVSTRRYMP